MLNQPSLLQLPALLASLQSIDQDLEKQQKMSQVVMLLGDIKAGKTTLLYYLTGKGLKKRNNQLGVDVLEPEKVEGHAEIGSGFNAVTLVPNIFKGANSIAVIDMPGFSERQLEPRLSKLYAFHRVLQSIDSVHLCYLLPQQLLEPNSLHKQVDKMASFLSKEVLYSERYVSFVLSKVADASGVQQGFCNFMEEIKEEADDEKMNELIGALLNRKRYVFGSSQPQKKAGQQLMASICKQNTFFPVNKKPQAFLSQQHLQPLLGDSLQQQFAPYLNQLLTQAVQTTLKLLRLVNGVLFYEYLEVTAELEASQKQKDELSAKLVKRIDEERKVLWMEGSEDHGWVQHGKERKDSHAHLLSIFTKPEQHKLGQHISKLIKIFDPEYQWVRIKQSFIVLLRNSCLQLSKFIFALSLLHASPELRLLVDQFITNQELVTASNELYDSWQANSYKLKDKQHYSHLFEGQQTLHRVVKVKQYNRVRNIAPFKKFTQSSQTEVPQLSEKHSFEESIILHQDYINQMQNTSRFLELILSHLKTHKQGEHITRAILDKASLIFSRHSMFEEAIICSMAAGSSEQIQSLLNQGLLFNELSPEFIRQIVVKYYQYDQNSLNRIANLQLCWQQLRANEKDGEHNNLRQDIDFRCNINIDQETHVNLHYVSPLLQDLPYHLNILNERANSYEKSECLRMLRNTREDWCE